MFIFTGATVFSVLQLAEEYQMPHYKSRCAVWLKSELASRGTGLPLESLVCSILAAEIYNLKTLLGKAIDAAMLRMHRKLKDVKGFDMVTESTKLAIKDRRLDYLEKDLFDGNCQRQYGGWSSDTKSELNTPKLPAWYVNMPVNTKA
jgi:hypothetical protein